MARGEGGSSEVGLTASIRPLGDAPEYSSCQVQSSLQSTPLEIWRQADSSGGSLEVHAGLSNVTGQRSIGHGSHWLAEMQLEAPRCVHGASCTVGLGVPRATAPCACHGRHIGGHATWRALPALPGNHPLGRMCAGCAGWQHHWLSKTRSATGSPLLVRPFWGTWESRRRCRLQYSPIHASMCSGCPS